MQNENILIDQLEDQLIDHPDASTTQQLKESSYDETFQQKLNERANQLCSDKWGSGDDNGAAGGYLQFLVTKPVLNYEYTDTGLLQQELSEWFAYCDFEVLGLSSLRRLGSSVEASSLRLLDLDLHAPSSDLDRLTYFVLGNYAEVSSTDEQLTAIVKNCQRVVSSGIHEKIFALLKSCLATCTQALKSGNVSSLGGTFGSNYFKLLTVTYFTINASLATKVAPAFASAIHELELMLTIVASIDQWKQHPTPAARSRNLLVLLWKLIMVEFGDQAHLKKVDEYLVKKHDIRNKDRKNTSSTRLTCSPLDYYTFRENLMDKYPTYSNETGDRDHQNSSPASLAEDHSSFMAVNTYSTSLSKLLEIPRTNKSHTILGQLPIQTVHIATPVPSPPSTPSDFMSGGEKIRKQYHVNQGVPLIYPLDADQDVPEAIKEALSLLENAVYESYSIKRLWEERQKFMAQERGNADQYVRSENEPLALDEHATEDEKLKYKDEITSLERVEKFYSSSLVHLHGLVGVIIGVIKSNRYDFNLKDAELEFDSDFAFSSRFGGLSSLKSKMQHVILRQLELVHLKELSLKACSAILLLLMKWFKVSHVLKSQFFSSLLFDQQYFSVFVDFLGCSFNNTELQDADEFNKGTAPYNILISQNKIMNPAITIPQFEFFNNCRAKVPPVGPVVLINKNTIANLPSVVDEDNQKVVNINQFNSNFCFILTNLLNVTNKVLIKNISQRVFVFNDTKPTDLLKVVLLNFINDDLRLPILKIFKKLIPYQGRKWRALNMDVISLIYLHLKLSLNDNWLSGRDLECDFNNSYDQEIALRSLLQFYNIRKYPEQMLSLGYALTPDTIQQVEFDESLYS